MALFDWFTSPAHAPQGGGLFGSGGNDQPQQVNKLQVLGAMLQDLAQNYQGKPGTSLQGIEQRIQRLGDQKKYQETLKGLFGNPDFVPVNVTPAITAPGQYEQRKAAGEYNQPSMMFSGPLGQSLGYDQSAAMLPLLQGMRPDQGLSVALNALFSAQERKDRKGERMEDRQWHLQDRADDRGYRQKERVEDRQWAVQDRNTITPYQNAQLGLSREQLNLSRQNAMKGEAAPSGYRKKLDGTLEFIPGGPADPAVAGRGTGKPTEDQAKNAQLYTLSKQILPQVMENFNSLSSPLGSLLSFGGSMTTPESYKQAESGLNSLVANFLYSTSGATATPQEVENRAATVRPKPGDSEATLALKRKAVNDMVESIKMRASPQLLNQQPSAPANSGGWGIKRLP